MSMDDPGWDTGLTPPVPQKPGGGGFDRRRAMQIGAIIVVIVVVIVVVVLSGGKSNKPSGSAASTSTSTSTSTSSATSSTTSPANAAATIPVLGVAVTPTGQPVKNSSGTQVSITDASGKTVMLTGVTVTAVRRTANVAGTNKPTPASIVPLKTGDEIWGISEIQSSSYTPVASGAVLTTFVKNYAVSGHTDNIYIYYFDPSANQNFDTSPPQVPLLEAQGSLATIDCTSSPGC